MARREWRSAGSTLLNDNDKNKETRQMSLYHDAKDNPYILAGDNQNIATSPLNPPHALVFIHGDHDTFSLIGATNSTVVIQGSNDLVYFANAGNSTAILHGNFDSLAAHGGFPTTITGFNSTDALNLYGLWLGPDGKPVGADTPASALITSDHHGGCNLMYTGGSIHFVGTDADVIRGDHNITASMR
jgi:hypothetical protein